MIDTDLTGFFPTKSARHNISRYLLRIVVTALAAMALIAVGLVVWSMTAQRKFAEAEMSLTVKAIATALDQQLLITTSALEGLAAAMAVDGDPERLYQIAQAIKDKHPYWSHVTLRNADGSVVFSTAFPYGTSMKAADITSEITRAIDTGRPQISRLLYGPIAGAHVAAVLVPAQARDGKRYALVAVVTASKWETLLQNQMIPDGWVAGIIDQNGVVVARTRAATESVGKPAPEWVQEAIVTASSGHANGPALEGEPLSLVFSRSTIADWAVAFAAPDSLFEVPRRHSMWVAIIASALALGGASLLVLRYARRLSRSITELVQVAEAMRTPGEGLPPPPPNDFEELSNVYNTMQSTNSLLRRAEEHRIMSMRELQHRVKNDLQSISSLLVLEGSQAKSEETFRIIDEMHGRIEALRLVHARLYEANQVSTVDLGGYLRDLCTNAVNIHGVGGMITIQFCISEVCVDHNTAVSLGLIANEFITNSTKHAFPEGIGEIMLELDASCPEKIHMRLADDGVGLPAQRTRNSGIRLIEMLAQQVDAELAWTTGNGTSLSLSFQIPCMADNGP
ncbi:sensor histidine kinase [Azospirillum sp. A1-3]|uniref:sensor histidine kinase n=1 Tax=Azospirillum sp. A1-3 TaxID=185874 RepID=UPI0020777062|nr:sensor histidine kinase [Azospirillum sp. A1-3]MCM8733368.1 sensor histidine kinase [Azospirillum sp. A1-3]